MLCHSSCTDYLEFRKQKDSVIEERAKLSHQQNLEFERILKTKKEFTRRTGKSVWR